MKTEIIQELETYNKVVEVLKRDDNFTASVRADGYCEFTVKYNAKIRNGLSYQAIKVHEYGHVYYNHVYGWEPRIAALQELLLRYKDALAVRIKLKSKFTMTQIQAILDKVIVDKSLGHLILNIAGDFQINSTLMTYPEFQKLCKDVNSDIGGTGKGYHPRDFGIKEVNDFSYYIQETVLNIGKVINWIEEEFLGDGGGDGKDAKNDDKIIRGMSRAIGKEAGKSSFVDIAPPINKITEEELMEIIKKYILQNFVITRTLAKDLMYKSNRNRTEQGMIVPHHRILIKENPETAITFLTDVSPSVDMVLLARMMSGVSTLFKEHAPDCTYDMVTWGTQLVEHFKGVGSEFSTEGMKTAGGTKIANGFQYVAENTSKKSLVVILSDFEDDMEHWKREEYRFEGRTVLGVNYGRSPISDMFSKIKVCNL